MDGSSKREFCSTHKRAGMVNSRGERCGHPRLVAARSRHTAFFVAKRVLRRAQEGRAGGRAGGREGGQAGVDLCTTSNHYSWNPLPSRIHTKFAKQPRCVPDIT